MMAIKNFLLHGGGMGESLFNKLIRQTEEHIEALSLAIGQLEKRTFKCQHTHEMQRAFALMSEASAARKHLLEKLIKEDRS